MIFKTVHYLYADGAHFCMLFNSYKRISLETASMDYFIPARQLYLKHGFNECPPFAQYKEDPNSIFMTSAL